MDYLNTKEKQVSERGTTLIEISVVIAVLLVLVGVLFIGLNAWRSGANQAACIVNLASIQKAVRGYESLNGLQTGAPLTVAAMTSAGFWSSAPVCPGGGTYGALGTVPTEGVAYMTCSITGHSPSAKTLANW
jgi:type II secretory pathway pseudopilin PulG